MRKTVGVAEEVLILPVTLVCYVIPPA